MDATVLRQRADLVVIPQPDGWFRIHLPDDSTGVILDPIVSAIWSAADGQPLAKVAQSAQVSAYLASCTMAVLQRAGMLIGDAPTVPTNQENGPPLELRTTVSAIIIHRDSQPILADRPDREDRRDLEGCLTSVLGQEHSSPVEIVVVTTKPAKLDATAVRLVQCQDDALAQTLDEQMSLAAGEAILLLDSQISLGAGSLAEMVRILGQRDDIAAVAPRVMWKQWPGFVTYVGDWRSVPGIDINPYAGQLDVGQFGRRWQKTPAVHPSGGLIDRTIWQQERWGREHDPDWMLADWCERVQKRGYHVLAATQALAYGPWLGRTALVKEQTGQVVQDDGRRGGWIPPGHGPMVHEEAPALTLDGVRSVYSQYPVVAPLVVRRRVAVLAEETPRRQALLRDLTSTCELNWIEPDVEEKEARQQCQTADMIITTAECLARFKFLQRWHRPVLSVTPPADAFTEAPESWLLAVDGLVCDSQEEGQAWSEHLASMQHTQPPLREGRFPGGRVMLLSTQDESAAYPSLAEFCQKPHMAPDRELDVYLGKDEVVLPPPPPTPIQALPAKAWETLRQRGGQATAREVAQYVRWKLGL
jgi:hypothetical protein